MPEFLDAAWLDGLTPDGVRCQDWYKHIGRGQSIRTAKGLPLELTKRMAHHFVRAPTECPIPEAFRYAQVLGLGGDERLARSLLATRLGSNFQNNDFWETVIRWFIEQPMLDPVHHGPIIDYVYAQKFVPSVANPRSRQRGKPRQCLLVPPQPNLSMKGRTAVALLRSVERWHKTLRSVPTLGAHRVEADRDSSAGPRGWRRPAKINLRDHRADLHGGTPGRRNGNVALRCLLLSAVCFGCDVDLVDDGRGCLGASLANVDVRGAERVEVNRPGARAV